ncbi:hypothetical protein [Phaeobacter sp. C3_T13_0]|uniref:hypothetical protein n=1 Tax=Phaeobacter cretensis TaxID=3342641 RepID=UPI0039BD7D4D
MYDPSSPLLRPVVSEDGVANPEAKARFAEDRLLDAVIWCELRPGEVVTESDVMERFGLTKAAARSGLARLGYDGWAMPQPRTGWRILSVSGALIGDVIGARHVAEPALATLNLDAAAKEELTQIAPVLTAMEGRTEAGAVRSVDHYLNRVDGIMLEHCNPFTARHLRKLWHHTSRIVHYFESAGTEPSFRRQDGPALIQALCADDQDAVIDARKALIDALEAFFLKRLLRDQTPLSRPGAQQQKTKPTSLNRTNQ